jgi:hypothetical protein
MEGHEIPLRAAARIDLPAPTSFPEVRHCPYAPSDLHEAADDPAHHLVEKAVGLDPEDQLPAALRPSRLALPSSR